jgi:hypothetical protein
MIDITSLKKQFIQKYPSSMLSKILATEPDKINDVEFLVKALTWVKILNSENKENGGG